MFARSIYRFRPRGLEFKPRFFFCAENKLKQDIDPQFTLDQPKIHNELKKPRLQRNPLSERKSSVLFSFKDLRALTKIELSGLNTFVALCGYMMMPTSILLSTNTAMFCLATQLMAMSSQSANQIIEREHDKSMIRTSIRPLPKGTISTATASMITFSLYSASNYIYFTMFPPGALIMANVILYSYLFVYTPLKRKSEMNTFFGSIVGSLPPSLGWMAAGGSFLDFNSLVLFSFLMAWQFPHFYGILWTYRNDYDNTGYKMLNDHKEATRTMWACLGIQVASTIALTAAGSFSWTGLAIMAPLFYKYSFKSIKAFGNECSVENAKLLKKGAYMPFLIFFLILLLNIAGLTPEQLLASDVVSHTLTDVEDGTAKEDNELIEDIQKQTELIKKGNSVENKKKGQGQAPIELKEL